MRATTISILPFLLFIGSECAAAPTTTDAAASVRALLTSLGLKPVTHHRQVGVQKERCQHIGHGDMANEICTTYTEYHDQADTRQEILTASNLRIVTHRPLTIAPPRITALPERYVTSGMKYYNCSTSISVSQASALSIAFQRSASVTVNHSVTHSQAEKIGFQWKITDSFTLNGDVTVNDQQTDGTADTSGQQMTIQRTATTQMNLPPQKAEAIGVQTWPVVYEAAFHALVIADADLSDGRKLHDYFAEDKRSFEVSGTFGFTDAADGVGINYDIPFKKNVCPAGFNGVVKAPFAPNPIPKDMLKPIIATTRNVQKH